MTLISPQFGKCLTSFTREIGFKPVIHTKKGLELGMNPDICHGTPLSCQITIKICLAFICFQKRFAAHDRVQGKKGSLYCFKSQQRRPWIEQAPHLRTNYSKTM
jgi:hypothetical protein